MCLLSGVPVTRVLGIDIGVVGALALLTDAGELVDIADMPVLADVPAGRRTVNGPLLAATVFRWQAKRAFVEMVGARPGEGAVGAFAFGRSRGIVEGVLAAANVPATFIAPASWKRAIGIPPGKDGAKDRARSMAISRWPAQADRFARVKDDGRAEACLIAVAGIMKDGRATL